MARQTEVLASSIVDLDFLPDEDYDST